MSEHNFSINLTVRINDLNYGNHVGHQNYFSFFQEARVAYLGQFGFSELDIAGQGMIVSEANCRYKQQLFLNDRIRIACGVSEIKSKLFVMTYQISKADQVCAEGFTRNLCYDYQTQKVVPLPEAFVIKITDFEK